ncbi:glycosyl hydrolase family 95 catalytic domain-containing protein [Maribacter algicola]|uniref:Glycosyl hydrolase family 95 catalytic domain-containing protein n=1 Tax=Meishania litoralis TaxID=3434685 RepID=A0ACC7LK45_9FLAO
MDYLSKILTLFIFVFTCNLFGQTPIDLQESPHDLHFENLADTWDEAIPLGNGLLGALIWKKEGNLRFSLDRADLWDLRPMENLKTPEWKYSWVYEQWKKDTYKEVQNRFDVPYDKSPAPSKIPGAALEFDISSLGEVAYVHLYIKNAICEVKWKNGVRLLTFVHATEPTGWYRFEGLAKSLPYELIPPAYNTPGESLEDNPVTGQDLRRLAYPQGKSAKNDNSATYLQEGWGGFKYQVHAEQEKRSESLTGIWSISAEYTSEKASRAVDIVLQQKEQGFTNAFKSHNIWWNEFWSKSSLAIPDKILEKQWYLEQYKFGSVARAMAPPISLQAVWTADNGKLPPWKGDFHHDLNTQLSYWPAYSGNHLTEETGFINWLWKYRDSFKKYTSDYYEAEGINVPGVTTLTGEPMGGWIQYSFGPTVSAWLAHHFYLHWRYSMDKKFLKEKAYPWIKDVAIFLDAISKKDENGQRKLPISSSPEIHNNSREAWFGETTNFDLALILWTYEKAAELAAELGQNEEADKWKKLRAAWPSLAIDDKTGLLFAPGVPYEESHRHFSHQIGYHPLGIIDFSKGENDRKAIQRTINTLDAIGSSQWVGYSFSWLANMKARAFDGNGAAEALKTFATSFCLPNSFHVNGDQSGKGYSDFTYRPFTLEGNFAFAAGLQEMLLQSHTGAVHVFPSIPVDWKNASFENLRAEGAFLVSAVLKNGTIEKIKVRSEKGGELKLKNPFSKTSFKCTSEYEMIEGDIISVQAKPGKIIRFEPKR